MPEHHTQRLVSYLAENPGAPLTSVLKATYGRTLVHLDELLDIFYSARQQGYGAAQNGLWYLIADNQELKEANHNHDSPGPVIDAAIPTLWSLRDTLGATRIDFTANFPTEGAPTP
jgi:hypothetical protein